MSETKAWREEELGQFFKEAAFKYFSKDERMAMVENLVGLARNTTSLIIPGDESRFRRDGYFIIAQNIQGVPNLECWGEAYEVMKLPLMEVPIGDWIGLDRTYHYFGARQGFVHRHEIQINAPVTVARLNPASFGLYRMTSAGPEEVITPLPRLTH